MQEMMAIYWPNRKTEPNWIDSITKYNRFGSVLQKLVKTEPNWPVLTPTWVSLFVLGRLLSFCCPKEDYIIITRWHRDKESKSNDLGINPLSIYHSAFFYSFFLFLFSFYFHSLKILKYFLLYYLPSWAQV